MTAIQLLKEYEAWEADLILDPEVWETSDGLPKLNQELYDRLIELQQLRNQVFDQLDKINKLF